MFLLQAIIILLISLIIWLPLDFFLGRRRQLKKVSLRKLPTRKSNLQLFTSGIQLIEQMIEDIQQATEHVHVLFYIIRNDKISTRFLTVLCQKAEAGVEVRVLLDKIGSLYLSKEMIQHLRKSGVHFSFCHKPRFPFFFYSLNQRNHRKITIIDGQIGYIGGFNIGEEYLGHNEKLGKWRDYHLRMIGEGVRDLQEQFLHDWYDETTEFLLSTTKYFPALQEGKYIHELVPTNGAYLKTTFLSLITRAKKRLYIGTPYFVPDQHIMKALIEAVKRGVAIAILVPLKADHPLVREAEFPSFRKLLKLGCNIYQYKDGFFHAKVIIVDNEVCDIGTANFDLRSLYLNHEMNCIIYDKEFIGGVIGEFKNDMQKSNQLASNYFDNLSFTEKCKEQLAKLIAIFL